MSDSPKADKLRQQREEKYAAEQARQRLEAEQRERMTIKPRTKTQMQECKVAEAKIAKRKTSNQRSK
jgi:hypothetical protein